MKKTLPKIMLAVASLLLLGSSAFAQSPQSGSIGLQGTIPSDPPAVGATITFPSNGQTFSSTPITVTGICPAGLEVRLYKNGVFAGAVPCGADGNYNLEMDLFSGENELIARVFDSLAQPGPDSNTVTVTYQPTTDTDDGVEKLILTTNFSSRGANPGQTIRWPMALAGGVGPYALSIDWGDGTIEPLSLDGAGEFVLEHIYGEPGVYKLVIKATDSRGDTAFIQLIAVANGPIEDSAETGFGSTGLPVDEDGNPISGPERRVFIVWPAYLLLFFVVSTFWIGRRYEHRRIREKLLNREGFKI